MTTQPLKVALAGASGGLGQVILTHLLAASHPVVLLTRSASSLPASIDTRNPLITVAEISYDSPPSELAPKLTGVNVLLSVVGTMAIPSQRNLITAAHSAGVTRVIPSEFGCDTSHPPANALPVYSGKVAIQDQLRDLASKDSNFSYTFFHNNGFLDTGLTSGFIANIPERKLIRYDGGSVPFSATTWESIAHALVSGLLRNLEATKNKSVFIQDVRTTQNAIVELVKEIEVESGKEAKEWEVTEFDTKQSREDGYRELKEKGGEADMYKIMSGFVRSAAYSEGWGGDFEKNKGLDNEVLGVKGFSEGEWREYVRKFV